METNNKTNSTEEVITLARADNSVMQLLGDIDTCCGDSCNMIYEMITFDSTYSFNRSYTFTRGYINLNLDTTDTLAHEGGTDGSYSFKFSSTDTQLSCQIIDTDDWSIIGEFCGNSVNVAMLLSDEKLYKIIIEPDNKNSTVTIDVDISYTVYTNIGQIDVVNISKPITVRKNDKFTLHFENSIENNCTWTSSNPSIISVGLTSGLLTAHKLGTATITFTNPCGCSYSVVVRSVIDYVDVMDDKLGLEKVVFRTTGKTWHCVYCDTVFEEPINISDTTYKRNNLNYFLEYDVDSDTASVGIKDFSKEELSLLYVMDPLGVANYVNRYANYKVDIDYLEDKYITSKYSQNKLRAILKYKDDMFFSIFGKKPIYFAYDEIINKWYETDDTWYETNEEVDFSNLVSESESIFGFHSIINITEVLEFIALPIKIVIEGILKVELDKVNPEHKKVIEAINEYKDYISFIVMLCTSEELIKDLLTQTLENIADELEIYPLNWISKIKETIEVINTINEFVIEIQKEPHYVKPILEHCVDIDRYDIYINSKRGLSYNFREILSELS